MTKKLTFLTKYIPLIIFVCFFTAYLILSIVKHNHFLTGYDLGIVDQGIWKYSQLKVPLISTHAFAHTSILEDHFELIFILIAPIYRLFNHVYTLIFLYVLAISSSGMALFLFSRKKGLNFFISIALVVSYYLFYGLQNAIWADVHSLGFAASFIMWFIYFLELANYRHSWIFFILAIICKEDIALITLAISISFYLVKRDARILAFIISSLIYLGFVFIIYFPFLTPGYRFQNSSGLLSNLNIVNMYNTEGKREVILYSLLWFGLIPIGYIYSVVIAFLDLAHYFILGNDMVTSAQSMFMHYRITLGVILAWGTVESISKYKVLQNKIIGLYIILMALFLQYYLHLPLSYLSKEWFWTEPSSVTNILSAISYLPESASVATQNNIAPHLTHRDEVLTIWPDLKEFSNDSPCGLPKCRWLFWKGTPQYLLVDISKDWDIRHFLANREDFISGLNNIRTSGMIEPVNIIGDSQLYRVINK